MLFDMVYPPENADLFDDVLLVGDADDARGNDDRTGRCGRIDADMYGARGLLKIQARRDRLDEIGGAARGEGPAVGGIDVVAVHGVERLLHASLRQVERDGLEERAGGQSGFLGGPGKKARGDDRGDGGENEDGNDGAAAGAPLPRKAARPAPRSRAAYSRSGEKPEVGGRGCHAVSMRLRRG